MKRSFNIIVICIIVSISFISAIAMIIFQMHDSLKEYLENSSDLTTESVITYFQQDLFDPQLIIDTSADDPLFLKTAVQNNNFNINEYIKQAKDRYYISNLRFASKISGKVYDGSTVREIETDDKWYYSLANADNLWESTSLDKTYVDGMLTYNISLSRAVYDKSNNFIGAVELKTQTTGFEAVISLLAKQYNLSFAFIAENGDIICKSDNTDYPSNIFDDPMLSKCKEKLSKEKTVKMWLNTGNIFDDSKLVVIKYLPLYECYLIGVENNSKLHAQYRHSIILFIALFAVALILALVLIIRQIRGYSRKIIRDATIDELTGIPNRKAFIQIYMDSSEKSELINAQIFMLDVDKFKTINDTFGHAIGDKALSLLGGELAKITKGKGFCARWGGDEFIGVLYCDVENAKETLGCLCKSIKNSELGKEINMTLSIGVSTIEIPKPLSNLTEKVDKALYAAKNGGRDRIFVNSSDD
ncbi:MAG: sensor domain-containing diguanylate cyclase [Ruminococcus sp.]|jgi:diguanylate cyclase (GGDEF)-like protein|nr:sensor domain-containing diguanylate cyclase [Ruminococcus sp.]